MQDEKISRSSRRLSVADWYKRAIAALKEKEPGFATSALCRLYAALLALLLPVVYRNGFIDINTFKYEFFTVFTSVFIAAIVLTLIARWMIEARRGLYERTGGGLRAMIRPADIAVIAFLLVNISSCLLSADIALSVAGTRGRRTGLLFYLLLGALYFIVSRADGAAKWALRAFYLSGTFVSILAVLNFFLIDPLGMYANLIPAEHEMFIATVGNRNFFGALNCLYLPMCMALFVYGEDKRTPILAGIGAFWGFAAMLAGRSDSTYAGFAFAFLALAFFSLREWRRFRRLLSLGAVFCAALLPMRLLYARFPALWMPASASSIMLTYPQVNFVYILGAVALIAAACLWRRDIPTRPLRVVRQILIVAIGLIALAILLGMFYFTAVNPSAPLEDPFDILRFSDNWGNHRGYAWSRTIERFAGAEWWQKLIGFGPDMYAAVMIPAYGDEMVAVTGAKYDNAHNEYLQYLITSGIIGLAAFLALIGARLRALKREAKTDALFAVTLFLPLLAYAAQAFFNINQPATTPLFFLFLSLTIPGSAERLYQSKPKTLS